MSGKSKFHIKRRIGTVFALVFIFVGASNVFAQTEMKRSFNSNKVVLIDVEAFDHQETGIVEVTAALGALEAEFKAEGDELTILYKKIEKLSGEIDEIAKLSKSGVYDDFSGTREALANEREAVRRKYAETQSVSRRRFEKRRAEILAPIMIRLFKKLEQFKKERGYGVVLDKAKLEEGAGPVTGNDELPDITREFIEYYNSVSEKPE